MRSLLATAFALLVVTGTALAAPHLRSQRSNKIVGGTVASEGDYPFMVALTDGDEQYCGGSLVNEKFVLTAAHCVYEGSAFTITVGEDIMSIGGGLEPLKSPMVDSPIKEVYIPKGYATDNADAYDIALIELTEAVSGDGVEPVAMWGSDDAMPAGEDGRVMGWGTTEEGGIGSDQLLYVDQEVKAENDCFATGILPEQFCAGGVEGEDSCQGDSGGPFVVSDGEGGWVQLGVVSWGQGCARENFPGVYTSVNHYREWIDAVIAGTHDESDTVLLSETAPDSDSDIVVTWSNDSEGEGEGEGEGATYAWADYGSLFGDSFYMDDVFEGVRYRYGGDREVGREEGISQAACQYKCLHNAECRGYTYRLGGYSGDLHCYLLRVLELKTGLAADHVRWYSAPARDLHYEVANTDNGRPRFGSGRELARFEGVADADACALRAVETVTDNPQYSEPVGGWLYERDGEQRCFVLSSPLEWVVKEDAADFQWAYLVDPRLPTYTKFLPGAGKKYKVNSDRLAARIDFVSLETCRTLLARGFPDAKGLVYREERSRCYILNQRSNGGTTWTDARSEVRNRYYDDSNQCDN